LKFEELLRTYDEEKSKFLSSFIGQVWLWCLCPRIQSRCILFVTCYGFAEASSISCPGWQEFQATIFLYEAKRKWRVGSEKKKSDGTFSHVNIPDLYMVKLEKPLEHVNFSCLGCFSQVLHWKSGTCIESPIFTS
jgi:hypothetical protein